MPEFYTEAIAAAASLEGDSIPVNRIPDLNSWQAVARELKKLSPAAQCHAIYADWLLQLHKPGGDTQIQIRNLLLGQGALAANYLAEFAQNAWTKIAKSLGSQADPEAFEALNGTVSIPFKPGKNKRVAVKVIDPRGNEVMAIEKLGDE